MGKSKTVQKQETKTDTSRVDPLLNAIISRSQNLRGIEDFLGPRQIADFTQDELNAFQAVRNLQGMFDTDINQARNLFGLAGAQAAKGAPTQEDLNPYINPFIGNVLDTSIKRMNQDRDRQLLGLSSSAARSGAFGGSRQAIAEAALNSGVNQNIGDLSARTYSDAFNFAMNEYQNQIARRINAGQALMSGAQMGLNQKLTEAGALQQVGLDQRTLNQARLDSLFDFGRMRYDDQFRQLEGLGLASSAFPYSTLSTSSTTTTQQKANPFNQLLGAASLVGSFFGGGGGGGMGQEQMPGTPNPFQAANIGGVGSNTRGVTLGGNTVLSGVQGSILGARQQVNLPSWLQTTPSPTSFKGFAKGGLVKRTKKEVAPKRAFAYGGRVGNPFSMGDSSEVIQKTQNPFTGPLSQAQFGPSTMENFAGTGALESPNDNSLRTQFPSALTPNNVGYSPTQVPTDLNSFQNPFAPPENPVADLMELVRGMRQDFMERNVEVNPQTTQGFAEGGLVNNRSRANMDPMEGLRTPVALGQSLLQGGYSLPTNNNNPFGGYRLPANRKPEQSKQAPVNRKRQPQILDAVVPRKPGEPDAFTKAVAGRANDPMVGAKVIEEGKKAEQANALIGGNTAQGSPMNGESRGWYNPEGGNFLGFEVANMDLLKFGLALLAGQDIGEAGLSIIAGKEEAMQAENEARAKLAFEQEKQKMQLQELLMRSAVGREDALFKDSIGDANSARDFAESAALKSMVSPEEAARLGLARERLTLDQQKFMAELTGTSQPGLSKSDQAVKSTLDIMNLLDKATTEDPNTGTKFPDPKKSLAILPEAKRSLAFYLNQGDVDNASILEDIIIDLESLASGRIQGSSATGAELKR